ncbi:MAG: class I SAM-dependent methyltransferase [Pirellulales bacterium]|nr:class I SAM-dependent methyltransferase [Pirellulales bacterium]
MTETQMRPFFEDVRAHYDTLPAFFALFLDPTMTYSSGYFEREDMTLEEAQIAKIDMSLRKAGVQPGHRLLEVGFGWGYTMRYAAEQFQANVVGLTLSEPQNNHILAKLAEQPLTAGSIETRVNGWEQFNEPVDSVISLEVFEHFRYERYQAFFDRMHAILPDGGRMLIQTNLRYSWHTLQKQGIEVSHDDVIFAKFIQKVIFPGGQLCEPSVVVDHIKRAGFQEPETVSLAEHYIPTLDMWAANLEAHKDEAIELTSKETYENFLWYLTGCAQRFRTGHIDVYQFACIA